MCFLGNDPDLMELFCAFQLLFKVMENFQAMH